MVEVFLGWVWGELEGNSLELGCSWGENADNSLGEVKMRGTYWCWGEVGVKIR